MPVPEEGIRLVCGRGELRPYPPGAHHKPAQAVNLWGHRRRGSRRQLSLYLQGS